MLTSSTIRWVSVTAAARELGVSPQRVRQLIKSGGLAGEMSGGVWLVSVASITARIAQLTREGIGDGSSR